MTIIFIPGDAEYKDNQCEITGTMVLSGISAYKHI